MEHYRRASFAATRLQRRRWFWWSSSRCFGRVRPPPVRFGRRHAPFLLLQSLIGLHNCCAVMHQPHSQRPGTCSKARLQGLRLCAPVLLTLVFGGWLLKEASAAGGREFTWLNRALFGERTTGFCCRQHMCVTRACLLPAWRSRYADMRGYPLA